MARIRLEIAQEIGRLNLTERARQRLINSIRAVQKSVREAEREIDNCKREVKQKAASSPKTERDLKRRILMARKKLLQIELDNFVSPVEIKTIATVDRHRRTTDGPGETRIS